MGISHPTLCSCSAEQMLNPRSTDLIPYLPKPKANLEIQPLNWGHTPRYFHTLYPIKIKPNAFYWCPNHHLSIRWWFLIAMMSSWQILLYCNLSWKTSGCLFHGLPYLCTLHFCIVLERLFTQLTSPALSKKPGPTSSPMPVKELWVLKLLPWQFWL